MLRLAAVFATVLALISVVHSGASQEPPAPRPVVVNAVCPANPNGPVNVTVNPWLLELKQGDNARWNLNTNSKDNKIVIEAKETSGWPYPQKRHEGNGAADADNMRPGAEGEYTYNITIYCDAEKIVIDPRVRVGP